MKRLEGVKIAALVADQTHDEELNFPKYWLEWEGAKVIIVGLSKQHTSKFGRTINADLTSKELNKIYEQVDCILIPGGYGPDRLRTDENILAFVKKAFEDGKLIAAICHGPQVLISAGVLKGKKLTCYKAVVDDVKNAGAYFVDERVVIDGNLITSRLPTDLPAFTQALINTLIKRKG
jgi:protease I